MFEQAFADVQQNFTDLFSTLFPGGAGKLVLTDPDDLLNTGHRDGGAAVGQERAPPLAALRWRALAHRAGVPVRACSAPGRRPST